MASDYSFTVATPEGGSVRTTFDGRGAVVATVDASGNSRPAAAGGGADMSSPDGRSPSERGIDSLPWDEKIAREIRKLTGVQVSGDVVKVGALITAALGLRRLL